MPIALEIMMVVVVMLFCVVCVFLLLFVIASALFPVEKSLSKIVWDMMTPKRKPSSSKQQQGGFRGFNERNNRQ